MKKRAIRWVAGLTGLMLFIGVLVYDGVWGKTEQVQTSFAMGGPVTVTVHASKQKAGQAVLNATQAINELDSQISAKNSASQIGRLNQAGALQELTVLEELKHCLAVSELTGGAFDITVGALSRLWDFDDGKNQIPGQAEIDAALATVGYQKVSISGTAVTIPKGTLLDLGAAGKGLACSRGIAVMDELGCDSGIVTVGGSVGVYGKAQTVGVRDPFGAAATSFATVHYGDAVASTSGIYEKSFKQDGVTYHHILDPATGWPVQNDLVSVTVICPDGLASDALATACFKLGVQQSRAALDAYGAMGIFVYRNKTVQVYNEIYTMKLLDNSYEKQLV